MRGDAIGDFACVGEASAWVRKIRKMSRPGFKRDSQKINGCRFKVF